MTTCEWFALCDNEAAGVVKHPALGNVPTCRRCADRLGLKVEHIRITDQQAAYLDARISRPYHVDQLGRVIRPDTLTVAAVLGRDGNMRMGGVVVAPDGTAESFHE